MLIEGLRDYSDFLAKCLTMKLDCGSLDKLDDITEIQEMTSKLPDWCANKWNDKAYNYRIKHRAFPTFDTICTVPSKRFRQGL